MLKVTKLTSFYFDCSQGTSGKCGIIFKKILLLWPRACIFLASLDGFLRL